MSVAAEPRVHRWTRDEYYKMSDLGLFGHKRVELIEGQVIEMSPMGSIHATTVALVARAIEPVFGAGHFVRWQMPLAINDISEPEPDVAIIVGDIRDYLQEHPTRAALIIEVADSSLTYDREHKGSLYAKAGIADYWIVNLIDRQLEVYRDPVRDAKTLSGWRYATQIILKAGDGVSPLARPTAVIAVAEVLP